MKLTPRFGLALGILCSLLSAGAATAAALSAPPKDFTVIGKTVNVKEGSNDVVTFSEKLRDELRGPVVGRSRLRCDFGRRASTCEGSFEFDEGLIRVSGRVGEIKARVPGENQASTLPIVDGTGVYKDVTGRLIFNAITRRLSQERFDFR